MKNTALVLGATGGIGGAVASRLAAHAWNVRAMVRDPAKAQLPYETFTGDVMRQSDVIAAADGVQLIVHAVNPPGYRDWPKLVVQMLDNTIAAAAASGATVVLPAPVYGYGKGQEGSFDESAPQRPTTTKGMLRLEMERRLASSRVRGIVVRAGDFIGGSRARDTWFGQAIVAAGKPLKRILYPGRKDKGRAWAYVPDLAETMVRIAERREELPAYSVFNFGGYYFERGIDIAKAVQEAAGDTTIPVRSFPWWLLRPFTFASQALAGMFEMRYLWEQSVQLDNRKLVAFLGEEPRTPLNEAFEATMRQLGCLPERTPRAVTPSRVLL